MERRRDFFNLPIFQNFRAKLQGIQARSRAAAPGAEALKTIRGLGALFVAILLAWVSFKATANESIDSYRKEYWVQEKIWKQTLTEQGLSLQKELGRYSKLLQSHPEAYSENQTIWVSNDACAVYLPTSPYSKTAELWTCKEKLDSLKWRKLGRGLSGFEALVDFFNETPRILKRTPLKRANFVDPKEIHY